MSSEVSDPLKQSGVRLIDFMQMDETRKDEWRKQIMLRWGLQNKEVSIWNEQSIHFYK